MKTLKYISAFLILVVLASCEGVLEVEPRSSISDQQTIVDKGSAETAIRAVYEASRGYYGTSFQSIAYLSGDNVQWTGSQSQVQEFINHKVNPENSTIGGVWNGIYSAVNRANHIIAKVPALTDPLLTGALKNQITGEAYFIRALAYFDLARTWGGAPIITKPTFAATDNRGIAKSTQAQVYAQVLADLDLAEPLLPLSTDRYRATRKTVWALKSRFYLYQKDWAKAEEFADKVIADVANYELLAPYNSFFFPESKRGTKESVFEFYYSSNETNGHRGQWQPQSNGGTRQWAPNDAFVALVNNPAIGGTRSTLVAKDNQNRWFGNLYYRSPATDPTYVIRIAELYLIRAEARAQQGGAKLAAARADLDAVRNRSALEATPALTQADILLAIENERRFEFAFEAHRWFDLVRTGRAAAVLNVTDPNRLLMPIPIDQIQADKALVQNPGY
ncbi:MAG: RagB/SusD family nutrient uptake outer membrane protein [Daejeonella sp.]